MKVDFLKQTFFYLDRTFNYYFNLRATNYYPNPVELVTTMNLRENTFDIASRAIFTLKINTTSPNSVSFRVYDKKTGIPVLVNDRYMVTLSPTRQLSGDPQQLNIGNGKQ